MSRTIIALTKKNSAYELFEISWNYSRVLTLSSANARCSVGVPTFKNNNKTLS